MLVAFPCGYHLLLLLYLFLFTKCQLCCWGALFFFLGESESTNKGLNETWYRFLLTVTNDFDLYNAIIVSSFTASGNINLPILGSTIKFFVV